MLEGCGQKVLRRSSERLTPKRVKEQCVCLNECCLRSKLHGYDVKSVSVSLFFIRKNRASTLVEAAATKRPKGLSRQTLALTFLGSTLVEPSHFTLCFV